MDECEKIFSAKAEAKQSGVGKVDLPEVVLETERDIKKTAGTNVSYQISGLFIVQ